jgi:hypothetical protein
VAEQRRYDPVVGLRREFLREKTPLELIKSRLKFVARQLQDRALPDGLIIGVQKAGTTALYRYLRRHPGIAGVILRPDAARHHSKEVHYFDSNHQKSVRWYRAQFPKRSEGKFVIEATPGYIQPHAASRMHALLPEAKLVLSLRDPVDRAYSRYQHLRRESEYLLKDGEVLLSFRECVDRLLDGKTLKGDTNTLLKSGHYAEELSHLYTLYPREQVHLVNFAELGQDPARVVAGILKFFGLPSADLGRYDPIFQGGYTERMDQETEARLREYFAPHNARLEELLGYSMGWSAPRSG